MSFALNRNQVTANEWVLQHGTHEAIEVAKPFGKSTEKLT